VIIGGGEVGMETAIFLARMEKEITVLEMRSLLAMDSTPIHYYSMFREEWEKHANITGIVNATVTEIGDRHVDYLDKEGSRQSVPCDSIILATGMVSCTDEAAGLFVPGVKCHLVGDCNQVGNIQKINRNAFGITSHI
jgi:2-enoate reductase